MRRILFALLTVTILSVFAVQFVAAQTGAVATITAFHLNVRDYPDPISGNIIARVARNEVYNVTARSGVNHWWQIQLLDGRLGWVNGNYISVLNAQLVPTVNIGSPPVQQPQVGSALATATASHLNVRSTPDPVNGAIIARIGRNETYSVVGRSAINNWWELRLTDGRLGWVNGGYLYIVNAQAVPFVDTGVPTAPPAASTGRVTAFFLNVRTAPNPTVGQIIAVITRDETYPIIGRTSISSWWQIRLADGRTGWVSSRYMTAINGRLAPITG
jgi:uncharacterized protein YgiM (DUF1202 family)